MSLKSCDIVATFERRSCIVSNEIVLQKNIDSVYEEINSLIKQKKGNDKKSG